MAVENLSSSANESVERARRAAEKGYDTVQEAAEKAAEKGREAIHGGYEAVQRFAEENGLEDVRDFVRNEPWAAMAAAFALGWIVAQIMRRI
jgi:ElaB/YqjD/DUF883 family membrane-anchored ribosome-binding protein